MTPERRSSPCPTPTVPSKQPSLPPRPRSRLALREFFCRTFAPERLPSSYKLASVVDGPVRPRFPFASHFPHRHPPPCLTRDEQRTCILNKREGRDEIRAIRESPSILAARVRRNALPRLHPPASPTGSGERSVLCTSAISERDGERERER